MFIPIFPSISKETIGGWILNRERAKSSTGGQGHLIERKICKNPKERKIHGIRAILANRTTISDLWKFPGHSDSARVTYMG